MQIPFHNNIGTASTGSSGLGWSNEVVSAPRRDACAMAGDGGGIAAQLINEPRNRNIFCHSAHTTLSPGESKLNSRRITFNK